MIPPAARQDALSLTDILTLERVDDQTFLGFSRRGTSMRKFGGEVVGQAVAAATTTISPERVLHSAHSHFLRPGNASMPVTYRVSIVRDGGTFSTRRVEALQEGQAILILTASFQRPEEGLTHQVPTSDAPLPQDVPPIEETLAGDAENLAWARQLMAAGSVEMRFPETPPRTSMTRGESHAPRQRAWLRATDSLPDDPRVQAAAMTYFSDVLLLSTALLPHALTVQDPSLQLATLDHTIWLHHPPRCDEWFLYDQWSDWAGQGRGLVRGHIFDLSGRLIATTMQEGLIRVRQA